MGSCRRHWLCSEITTYKVLYILILQLLKKNQIFHRLFAIDNENVDDEDIVVTADSNLFVMSKDILDFLYQYPNMTAWVPKYHDTVKQSGPDGTFNQNLIAMKAKMWRQITRYDGKLKNLIQHFRLYPFILLSIYFYCYQLQRLKCCKWWVNMVYRSIDHHIQPDIQQNL